MWRLLRLLGTVLSPLPTLPGVWEVVLILLLLFGVPGVTGGVVAALAGGVPGISWALVVFLGVLVGLALVATYRLQSKVDACETKPTPALRLGEPVRHRETFYPRNAPPRQGTLYRIFVTNVGKIAAESVEVKITDSQPLIRQRLPTWLHQADDNVDGFLRTFTLPPGDEAGRFIDVVCLYDDEQKVMHIYHAVVGDWDGSLSVERCWMRITASSTTEGAETRSRPYEAWIDEEHGLQMRAAD